jgi:hypothetical protein
MSKLKAEGIERERNAWLFKPEFLESSATIALIPELVPPTKKLESYQRPRANGNLKSCLAGV